MKTKLITTTALAVIALIASASGQGVAHVYETRFDAPKTTKAPKRVLLKTPGGKAQSIRMDAFLCETRLDRDGSSGLGMRGSIYRVQRFIRLALGDLGESSRPARMEVNYLTELDDSERVHSETVDLDGDGLELRVDLAGYCCRYGTRVRSSYYGYKTTASKYKYTAAEIVALDVTVTDEGGKVLFKGGWPEAPEPEPPAQPVSPLRIYTDVEGREITAEILSVEKGTVTLRTRGREYTVPMARFSPEDRLHLAGLEEPDNY